MSKEFEPGMMAGSYRILSLLGKGGMGEVFLAEDTRLDRKVALKILPANLVHDTERLRRFTQEARAASALNHPNILTIYEIGEAEGAPFIATEFIQGETLRERMNHAHLTVREALDIAIQAAGALAAAHEAGIVHRDIKPENIMVRADGYIKILDFGLAKLTERTGGGPTETQAMTMTSPGMVMGTAQYMSPEQARGMTLDARSDLFSLGIVLYEMLAHKPPFEGATPSHLIVAILDRAPQPITVAAPEVPPQLEPILEKALAKDREERYQTAKDLAVDLKSVRRRLDVEAELRRTTPSGGYPAAGTAGAYGAPPGPVSAQQSAAQPAHFRAETAAAVSSAPHAVQPIAQAAVGPNVDKSRRTRRRIVRGALILIALSVVYQKAWLGRKNKPADTHSYEGLQISRVTTSGMAYSAAISPDGRYIVYGQTDRGLSSLWMRQTATASNIQIVAPAKVGYGGLTFSPDGNYLYFLRRSETEAPALYKMPVLGGSPQVVMKNAQTSVTFSPDGKRFAYLRLLSAQPPIKQQILIANADGSGEQKFVEVKQGEIVRGITWSPAGDSIAAAVMFFNPTPHGGVELFDLNGGSSKAVMNEKLLRTEDVTWANSDGDLLLLATDQLGSPLQIWHVDTDSSKARRLTNDVNGFSALAAATQTGQIVAIQPNTMSNLWTSSASDPGAEKQVTTGGARADATGAVTWTPDGKLVFDSRASGNYEIWIANADGSDAKQLTSGGPDLYPSVSPDGKYIVYGCVRSSNSEICRMNIDGSDVRQLTNIKAAATPSVSADSKWVLFHYFDNDDNSVYRVPIDGGKPEKMVKGNCSAWGYSPDGKWMFCGLMDANFTSVPKIGLIPATGGDVAITVNVPPVYASVFRFSPDSKSLMYAYRKEGATNIWSQPIDGGPPKQLTHYTGGRLFNFAFSPDGKQLVVAKGDIMTDVVLLKNGE